MLPGCSEPSRLRRSKSTGPALSSRSAASQTRPAWRGAGCLSDVDQKLVRAEALRLITKKAFSERFSSKRVSATAAVGSTCATHPFTVSGAWTRALCTGYEEVEGAPQWRIVPAASGPLTITLRQGYKSPSASMSLVPAHPRGAKVRGQPQVFGNFTTVCSTLTLPVLQGVAYTLIVCTYRGSLEGDDTELDWELTGSLPLREPPMPLTLLLTTLLRDEAEAARGAEQRRRAVFLARLQASSPGSTNREAWEDLQVASALVDAARAECRARGKAFDDGLSCTPAALGEGWPEDGKKAVWARFEQLAPHPAVFEGGYGLSDVRQGQLGDCYFCADMANLAGCLGQRLEGALDMLLVTAEANPEGVYCVRLWVGGRWQHFLLDDRLPCAPDVHLRLEQPGTSCSGPPNPEQGHYFSLLAVSSSNLNVMWPCLLEKAWARLHGSYAAIDADAIGDPCSPLNYFLPHSLKRAHHTLPLPGDTGQGEMWNNLLQWYSRGWPMTAGSRKEEVVGGGDSQGIVRHHAYSIMRLVGPRGSSSVGKRLIQLRNPWGRGGWGGRFGCKDTASWTPALQAATGHDPRTSRDDGTFWIPLTDFLFQFDDVKVTRNIHLEKDGGRWHKAVVRGIFVDEHLRGSAAKTDWLEKMLVFPQVLTHSGKEAYREVKFSLELDKRSRKKDAKHPKTVLEFFAYRSGSGDTPIKPGDHKNCSNKTATVEHFIGVSGSAGLTSLTQMKKPLPPGCSLVAIPTVMDLCGWEQASYTLNVTFEASFKCRLVMPGSECSSEEGVEWVSR